MDLHRFRTYGVAVSLLADFVRASEAWPRGSGWLRDQGNRAAGSVVLNIAEGLGKPRGAERLRFFRIAIASAHEAAACAEVARRLQVSGRSCGGPPESPSTS